MPRVATKAVGLGAIAAAAVIALPVGRSTPGAVAATTATTPPNAAVLLSTPVIVNGGPGSGYQMYVRTPFPLNGDDTQPKVRLKVRVAAISADGDTFVGGTSSSSVKAGGYCTRIDMSHHKPLLSTKAAPRVVVALFTSAGLTQRVYVRLQGPNSTDSKATATVPAAQSGCGDTRWLSGPG